MKILQIVPYFYPYIGGQENYIFNLSKSLIDLGHEVHILTSNYPKSIKNQIIEGIFIERCNCTFRPLRNPISFELFFSAKKKVENYDLIHTHNEHSFAAIISAYLRKKEKIPLVLTCHGQLKFGSIINDSIEKIYTNTVGNLIFKISDQICVNSSLDQQYILSINENFKEKISIVSNAIDPKYFDTVISLLPETNKIKLNNRSNNNQIILFVGRLIKRKGIEWLIKAFNILINEIHYNNIHLIIVGEGEDEAYFKGLVSQYKLKSNISFLGKISEKEKINLFINSTIFILPSLSEVCPTVVLEAMYYGLPVICSDIPGIRDHFKDNAILVPIKDEYSLARAINELLNDDSLNKKLSIQGKIFIKNHYTWDIVAKRYENLYKNCIKEGVL